MMKGGLGRFSSPSNLLTNSEMSGQNMCLLMAYTMFLFFLVYIWSDGLKTFGGTAVPLRNHYKCLPDRIAYEMVCVFACVAGCLFFFERSFI